MQSCSLRRSHMSSAWSSSHGHAFKYRADYAGTAAFLLRRIRTLIHIIQPLAKEYPASTPIMYKWEYFIYTRHVFYNVCINVLSMNASYSLEAGTANFSFPSIHKHIVDDCIDQLSITSRSERASLEEESICFYSHANITYQLQGDRTYLW